MHSGVRACGYDARVLRWADAMAIDLGDLGNLAAFKQRMASDAGVQAALKAEGLS